MNRHEVEAALEAVPAERVTAERVEQVIRRETFLRASQTLTICVLTLANGFTVTGESACAAPENYREDLGEHFAREDAKRKIWALEGYLLRERLALVDAAEVAPQAGMSVYVGTKVINAKPMTRAAYNALRGWVVPSNENPDDAGFLVEYADGQRPNVRGFGGYVSWSPADVFERAYGLVRHHHPQRDAQGRFARPHEFNEGEAE